MTAPRQFEETVRRRLASMTEAERGEHEEALAVARLALQIGEEIRAGREAAGLSQGELASRMSVSRSMLARMEAGGDGATPAALRRAETALELPATAESTFLS
ncbi:MAG: helix-turn-helix transcriptional regulator [Acidimicrobiaceae bacterium]|nr:helix-turn-helix transcriptional regulator [Acidimicrobiaceae bacterium]